jgi:hypothetical protein
MKIDLWDHLLVSVCVCTLLVFFLCIPCRIKGKLVISSSQNFFVLFQSSPIDLFIFNFENVITRRCKWNETVSNKKCNTLWLLIHSLPSNRSSSFDVVTLEITMFYYYAFATKQPKFYCWLHCHGNVLNEAHRWIWAYCDWNSLINASLSEMQIPG